MLIILSDISGLYTKNPKDNPDAELIREITNVDSIIDEIEIGSTNAFGTGGIKTKLEAAKLCNEYDIPMILADGSVTNIIEKVLEDTVPHTIFLP